MVLINYTPIVIGIHTEQGILTYVLVCQALMVFFSIDEWLDRFRAVRLLFPIILATAFAGLFLKPHSPLTIAFWFFIAGYKLDMHEKLGQSFREVRNQLVHVEIIETIECLYKERQIGWTLKVFWFVSFVNALPEAFIKKKFNLLVFLSTGSNNILQYFALFLVSVDVDCIVRWTVMAILKWSVIHRVNDTIECKYAILGDIKGNVLLVLFGPIFLEVLGNIFLLPQSYRHGAFVYLNTCCVIIVVRALNHCNETLQILSTSLLENIWTHFRAILLTFLLGLLIYMSWLKLSLNPLHSYTIADALVHTLKTLAVYMLNVYDFLSSNGIEQLEEKVYPLKVMANIFTIGGAIVGTIIFIYDLLRQRMSFIWIILGEWRTWFLGFQHLPLFLFERRKFRRFSIRTTNILIINNGVLCTPVHFWLHFNVLVKSQNIGHAWLHAIIKTVSQQ